MEIQLQKIEPCFILEFLKELTEALNNHYSSRFYSDEFFSYYRKIFHNYGSNLRGSDNSNIEIPYIKIMYTLRFHTAELKYYDVIKIIKHYTNKYYNVEYHYMSPETGNKSLVSERIVDPDS